MHKSCPNIVVVAPDSNFALKVLPVLIPKHNLCLKQARVRFAKLAHRREH